MKLPNSEKYLLVNSVFGAVDRIGEKEKETILKWKKEAAIIPHSKYEEDLYNQLCVRKYITTFEEEQNQFFRLVNLLKKRVNYSAFSNRACFVLTYDCNFSCPYCYEKSVSNNKTDLTKEQVDCIFANNPDINKIGFFGGEPLLPKNKKMIEYIIEKACPEASFSVTTNGYYLALYLDAFKKITIDNIQVTLDGTEAVHNRTRICKDGSESYKIILEGIKLFATNNIPLTIRMNVNFNNIEDCLKEKEKIQREPWGKSIKFEMQPLFQLSNTKAGELNGVLIDNQNKTATPNEIYKKSLPLTDFYNNHHAFVPIIRACDREGNQRFYDGSGYIYNCIIAVGNEEKAIGTYYPEIKMFDKSYLTRDITKIQKCMECPAALICGGGCPNGLPANMDLYSPCCYTFDRDTMSLLGKFS